MTRLEKARRRVVDEVIEIAGGHAKLAQLVGVSRPNIYKWQMRGYVPIRRVPRVAEVTGIPRHKIRPDLPDLFPRQAEAA